MLELLYIMCILLYNTSTIAIFCYTLFLVIKMNNRIHIFTRHYRGAATGWTGDIPPKLRGTSYVLVPPNFYHKINCDWLVPHTYTPSFQRPYKRARVLCVRIGVGVGITTSTVIKCR